MGQIEESTELTLDFTKLEKVARRLPHASSGSATAIGGHSVAVQNADTKDVFWSPITNEFAMKSLRQAKAHSMVDKPHKLWFKGETSGRFSTFSRPM